MVSKMDPKTKKQLETNPNRFVERVIKKFTRTSPLNRLVSFDNAPIFDEPLVGFADGDDPIFDEFKKVVHDPYLIPRELMIRYVTETLKVESPSLTQVSVISFAMPISRETLQSNAKEKIGPSLRWNHTRWKGQEFIEGLSSYLASLLQDLGYYAVAPELTPFFKIFPLPDGFASNWSQRHTAYAAGLGTFSLNEGFITRKGLAIRFGSVVTSLKLEPSERLYPHHLANCRFFATGKCGLCIQHCPGGAISEKGHDKLKCFKVLFEEQKPWLEGAHGPGYIGRYAGCGLCQTGVPCERRIPLTKATGKKSAIV